MLRELYDTARAVLNLADVLRENRAEIRAVREEMVQLARVVERQAHELARLREREEHERGRLALEMENLVLKNGGGRRAPAGRRRG